ncbi:PaaI family thioesterase [Oceanicoccus sp. KOV_DT_Chl]|uniref:PaaI family thioesterase n=1 Tax=Oceanicoccus sp. KOV_DT_Chl TaxID=1904639 RepID=UPI000C7B124A|nr:PaaI family thioesterase [Oceanicoccus sp. KOV_DT_Chl]
MPEHTTSTHQRVEQAIANRDMDALIAEIPYAQLIGIESFPIGDEFIFRMPQKDSNIGNPTLPAIHGGVLGGFMETAGVLYVMMFADILTVPKVVDFSIDYLSPGRQRDSFTRCKVVRQGRKIVNVSMTCWQTHEHTPIAMARANFLLSDQ